MLTGNISPSGFFHVPFSTEPNSPSPSSSPNVRSFGSISALTALASLDGAGDVLSGGLLGGFGAGAGATGGKRFLKSVLASKGYKTTTLMVGRDMMRYPLL